MNECAAVECLPAALNNPHEPVWWLRSWNSCTQMRMWEVQLDAATPKVSAKTLELALNIHEEMTRYQFRTLLNGTATVGNWGTWNGRKSAART